ncbi:hypothetical protein CPB84DRAFT_1767774 [Gymnopilus junonius]|uniref:Uncharacterized protein n=1 Tax=Gymnopilus junonius TaxID=109634 RepID=A0A9P5NWM5_GYMJU|nr:hypothetical protein CPB84DRAFT_1767774 [Gymnopilus junonius]
MTTRFPQVDPRLPLELECLIFECAASQWTAKDSTVLLVVAKRVNAWVYPIIFRVFSQAEGSRFPNFEKYPSIKVEDVGKFARHLLAGTRNLDLLLSFCPNVHNLALWYGVSLSEHLGAIRNLHLTRFSATFLDIALKELLLGPAFSYLTHLEILSLDPRTRESLPDQCSVIADIPKLSHLSIPVENADLVPSCLLQCRNLHVLILSSDRDDFRIRKHEDFSGIKDGRLVLMLSDYYVESEMDWINGAKGKVDSWITADLYVLARKSNFLRSSSRTWITSPFNWGELLNSEGKVWYSTLA